ncbi:MAG TPA: hypothetical protein VL307_12775 [Chitinophagaceae bacterium]|nr:hypothetical protein [Chitinophagaceae bacterium]
MSVIKTLRYHLLVALLLGCCYSQAQTDMDAIMMNKKQFCSGFDYMHSSWDTYWEGTLKRKNENLGTVTTQSVMFMPNYGINNKLNIMGSATYVWTKASAGTLSGLKGLQDASLFVKWIPYQKTIGKGKLTSFLVGGVTLPMTDYVIDFMPLSIGSGSVNFTGRAMLDYNIHRITVTGSAAYIRRNNVKLDRTSYYDTELHLSNEVEMPDAAQYQLRTGYRGKYLIAEALLTNWTTLGGFDITRNNMPFPSNRMNATSLGVHVKYTLPKLTNLSLLAGGSTVLSGRNMGRANAFNAGVFYVFYVSKKANAKN